MKPELTPEQFKKILGRVISKNWTDEDGTLYMRELESKLVEQLLRNSNQRKELQRLNQQNRLISSVMAHNSMLELDIETLTDLLDREDEENADTDPSQLTVTEDNFPTQSSVAVSVNQSGGICAGSVRTMQESYDEWDMRTRYPNLKPRELVHE